MAKKDRIDLYLLKASSLLKINIIIRNWHLNGILCCPKRPDKPSMCSWFNDRCVRGLTIDMFVYLGPDDAVSDSTDG